MVQAAALPPAAAFVLTRRIPCAVLASLMFMATLWLQDLNVASPLLASALAVLALLLHIATPGLFALVFFGGGLTFSVQVGLLSAIMVSMIGLSVLLGVLMLVLYALLPVMIARTLLKPGGLERSMVYLALGLGLAVFTAMAIGAQAGQMSIEGFADHLLAPWFEGLLSQRPPDVDAAAFAQAIGELRRSSVWLFPGTMILGVGMLWLTDILLARGVAVRYGFHHGPRTAILTVAFDRRLAYVLAVAVAIAAVSSGSVQYAAVNALLVIGGLMAVQGLAVAHMWLKQRQLKVMLLVLYIMLLIQPVMILPLVVLGVLDMWFDFRGLTPPASGG